ncbi:DUF6600 domain-containing protein [Algoriphagus sp. D3-2-R+10]|uniref:DUF6600 domain-containing protein n=1 Tax=Algoriphagus aurantiacus TaxID=3103948 RepID=UPI002B3CA14A|nr:DUF6600 domain-containing protein [Algoriphagus sp. D3-2-R+10]MEB2776983.1 DUF6600 domain-containing protein [Algoriphagus sp. D3-2-R+10]
MKTPQVPKWMRNLMMGIVALIWISPTEAQAENANGVSFQIFYDELMPYGDWVKDARYGYVWLPAVQNDFHPYGTNGHWVMTSYGNTWVSDYDWGWATFHYGRWYFDNNYQSWAWIPDYQWGPAWVDWRTGGGYYGWAPMGPGFTVNMRIAIPAFHWIFVPRNRFVYHNVYSYCVPRARRVNIYNNTTIINNTVVYNNNRYYAGPTRRDVERVTNRSYPERRIENSTTPGRTVASRNAVRAYRPDLQSARGTTTAARPSRILSSGQSRTQPATAPSRVNSRSESVSGRSGTTSAAPSRSSERASTPSRSDNSGVRSTTPTRRDSEFETRPYSGTQTRTATPNRQSEGTPTRTQSSAPVQRSNESRTQSAPTQRSNESRTQPAPTQRSTQPRTQPAPAQRSTQPKAQPAPSRSQSSSPARTAPARTTQTRQAQPAPSRSTPQVKSIPSRSSTPAQSSRTSSGSSSSRSSSKTRGNN